MQPHARASRDVRSPDITVSSGPTVARAIDGPLLIIEILSPPNKRETREAVGSCMTIPSLREAAMMRSQTCRTEIYRPGKGSVWPTEPVMLEAVDTLELTSIGFRQQLVTLYVD